MKTVYDFYSDTIKKYDSKKKVNEKKLKEVLTQCDDEYRMGKETGLTDDEYDRLNQIYFEISGKLEDGERNVRVLHDYPNLKGTLKKVHYVSEMEKRLDPAQVPQYKTLESWVKTTYDKIKEAKIKNPLLGFYRKFDGTSVVFSVDENGKVIRALTRGYSDTGEGVDKTKLFGDVTFSTNLEFLKGKKYGFKTEAVVSNENYEMYNVIYGGGLVDPRSAAVSLLSSDKFGDNHARFLTLAPLMYEVDGQIYPVGQEDEEFGPLMVIRMDEPNMTPDTLIAIICVCMKEMPKEYPVDGIVVRWMDKESINLLGRDTNSNTNNFEVAYKFRPVVHYSKVVDIVQDIGYLGNASFTVEFEPITIGGRKVSHASLGSYDRAKDMKLAVGDTIGVSLNTVPKAVFDECCAKKRSGNKPIKLISRCPYCGSDLVKDPVLRCNNVDCSSRIKGKIYNFCVAMKIKTIGPSTIDDLYRAGYLSEIEDLFKLKDKKDEIAELEGFGKTRVGTMIHQIDTISTTVENILGSVGIPGVRVKTFSKVLDKFTIDELLKISNDYEGAVKLCEIGGIGYGTASAIVEGIASNKSLIEYLLKHLKIKKHISVADAEVRVLFTGFRNQKFVEHLMKGGVAVETNFNKSVNLLIAANPHDDSNKKIQKAKLLGIPVISVPEAFDMFKFKI